MKKYKLNRWYPSLPEEWKIYQNIIVILRGDHYIGNRFFISKEEVENNPEFWEEIIKKDYEILSLCTSDEIFDKMGNCYIRRSNRSEEGVYPDMEVGGYYGNQKLEIYSVKRLSDDEIFTVGDEVNFFWNRRDKKAIISTIRIHKNKLEIFGGCMINHIKNLRHIKPLFTTQDGVDIFSEKDYEILWGVALQAQGSDVLRKGYYKGLGEYAKPYKNRKWFWSKEKAEEWIDLNKIRYSKQDILNVTTELLGKSIIKNIKNKT